MLDTHAWVWWVAGSRKVSRKARSVLERGMADRSIHVSSISTWEVGQLVARGRLELSMDVEDWVAKAEALPFLRFVPVDNRIALRAAGLPPLHSDPVDRLIVATALSLGAPLVTKDDRLRAYPRLTTIW